MASSYDELSVGQLRKDHKLMLRVLKKIAMHANTPTKSHGEADDLLNDIRDAARDTVDSCNDIPE